MHLSLWSLGDSRRILYSRYGERVSKKIVKGLTALSGAVGMKTKTMSSKTRPSMELIDTSESGDDPLWVCD